ncbi:MULTISPECIES: hypothetical protein [unclassified Corallococcus]|nr:MULTISPECIES: hypothetical protein [unclassified Corallococcus]MBN9684695.1 hypothetical protein [Corallococcus sp. NCSPR001]WAS83833.1 hypothetical protein O0N60_31590 [Corallococcus sp. NCRR]
MKKVLELQKLPVEETTAVNASGSSVACIIIGDVGAGDSGCSVGCGA